MWLSPDGAISCMANQGKPIKIKPLTWSQVVDQMAEHLVIFQIRGLVHVKLHVTKGKFSHNTFDVKHGSGRGHFCTTSLSILPMLLLKKILRHFYSMIYYAPMYTEQAKSRWTEIKHLFRDHICVRVDGMR